jgi:hypothetical protein
LSKRLRNKTSAVRRHPLVIAPLTVLALAVAFALSGSAIATTTGASPCTNAATLPGSAFEIDVNANLKADSANCIDWLNGTAYGSGVIASNDKPTGSGDDAFGQGTSENDANPTIVAGSIPPNKSDLKAFGLSSELGQASAGNPSGKFLQLFWSRVQNPSGTTNMDFELNQKFCDLTASPTNCANNGSAPAETPVRTAGDRLITYDLSKGGTVPAISIRTWSGSAWGTATVISGGANTLALGSVNTTGILAADGGPLGSQDAYTFGETSIAFSALFSGSATCGSFGSAYLKSRSSDSFSSEIKDFIAPESVHVSNCAGLTTTAQTPVTLGSPIYDVAHLAGVTANAGGTITFHLYSDALCATELSLTAAQSTVAVSGPNDYQSGNYTPTSVGSYYWRASYSGDANNAPASLTACGEAGETSVVQTISTGTVTHPVDTAGTTTTSITLGGSIYDHAIVSANAAGGGTPSGSIEFFVCVPAALTNGVCAAGTGTSIGSGTLAAVSPATTPPSADATSAAYTPAHAGTYCFRAVYTPTGSAYTGSNDSGSTAECVTVNALGTTTVTHPVNGAGTTTTSITLGGSIYDHAVVSANATGGGTPTGSVEFFVCVPAALTGGVCAAGNGTSIGTASLAALATTPPSADATSAVYTPAHAGTYCFRAVYTPTGSDYTGSNDSGSVAECVTVAPITSGISTVQAHYPNDTATITGGGGGTVDFKLYGPFTAQQTPVCTGSPVVSALGRPVNAGTASTANTTQAVTDSGTYVWLVTFTPADGDHTSATSTCGTEKYVITVTNG